MTDRCPAEVCPPIEDILLTEIEKKRFFEEVARFNAHHLRYKYPLLLHFSTSKQTIGALREIGAALAGAYSELVGISVYGSRARAYARLGEEDFDLILLHRASEPERLRSLIEELRRTLVSRSLQPCQAGTDYFDVARVELAPAHRLRYRLEHEDAYRSHRIDLRANLDPFWLFHGLPLYGTRPVIEARAAFLELAVSDPEYRQEWERVVKRLQDRVEFSYKAVARILASVKKGFPYPEEEPTWVPDLAPATRRILETGQEMIKQMVEGKNEVAGFRSDAAAELAGTRAWLAKDAGRAARRGRSPY